MGQVELRGNFETVYRRSYRAILRFAKGLCRTSEDAEDVAQETFARAYAAIGSFTHDRPIENWLIRIAQNAFLDLKRKERRRPTYVQEAALADDRGLETILDHRPLPDRQLEHAEELREVMRVLENLDEESRRLIQMAHVENVPYSEIAQRLGLKVATVRSRLHRACRRARKIATAGQGSEGTLHLAPAS